MEEKDKLTQEGEGWIVLMPKSKKEIKLDKRDQIILQALMDNARTSISTLAKMTKLSKNSVINRIKNYEKLELIDRYSSIIKLHALGFEMYSIGIKTKMTLAQKEKFVKHLEKIKHINQVLVLSPSHWDFLIRAYPKDKRCLDRIITQIYSFKGIIQMDIIPCEDWVISNANYFNIKVDFNRYIKKEDSSFHKTFATKKNPDSKYKVDKKDMQIMSMLSHNARIPLIEIASKINISPDAVKYRIKQLIKKDLIQIFFVNINPFMLGFNAYLFTFQIFNRTKLDEITKYLGHHPRSTGVITTKTKWNLFGALLFKDTKELKDFEEEFFEKYGEYVHDYAFTHILEQPYYRMFMKEILTSFK
ncbi:MAG: winged helix-turn-helix transcriptional regulator [archaeon]